MDANVTLTTSVGWAARMARVPVVIPAPILTSISPGPWVTPSSSLYTSFTCSSSLVTSPRILTSGYDSPAHRPRSWWRRRPSVSGAQARCRCRGPRPPQSSRCDSESPPLPSQLLPASPPHLMVSNIRWWSHVTLCWLTLHLESDLGRVQGKGEQVGNTGRGAGSHQLHAQARPHGGGLGWTRLSWRLWKLEQKPEPFFRLKIGYCEVYCNLKCLC